MQSFSSLKVPVWPLAIGSPSPPPLHLPQLFYLSHFSSLESSRMATGYRIAPIPTPLPLPPPQRPPYPPGYRFALTLLRLLPQLCLTFLVVHKGYIACGE